MREFSVTVPQNANTLRGLNTASSSTYEAIKEYLLGTFGGLTITQSTGIWRDPETSKVYDEPVAIFTFAVEKTYQGTIAIDHIVGLLKLCGEIAVYWKDSDGNATIS